MAINTNVVVLCGRLTRDPELRYTPTGKSVASFSIAVNASFNGKESVSYFDIEAWNGTGEAVVKHQRKGSRVIVHGELRQSRWTDNNGNRRSKVNVRAGRVEFVAWPNRAEPADDDTDGPDADEADAGEQTGSDPQPDPTDETF
jgi:single-strand DNA-binding protein